MASTTRLFNTNVPVLSLRTQETGQRMRDRMAYNASGIQAELACGDQITLHTEHAAQIPLTGVTYGTQVESYAGQSISTIAMGDNATVVIPGAQAATPAAIDDLTAIRANDDVVLTWSPTTQDTQGQPLGALVYRVYGKAGDSEFTPTQADLLAEVSSPTYTHLGAASSSEITTYVVTAVGNNCWKREIGTIQPPHKIRLDGSTGLQLALDAAAAVGRWHPGGTGHPAFRR